MFTAKDVIKDAFDRTGIYPDASDALPAEYSTKGVKLLRGLLENFNARNMILSTQRKARVLIPENGVIVAKKGGAFADEVASLQTVLLQVSDSQAGELDFIPFQYFDTYPNGAWVYTYVQSPDSYEYEVYVKPSLAGKTAVVHYNAPFTLARDLREAMDTKFFLPDEYEELFILGLGVKLFTVYKRKDNGKEENFKAELAAMVRNITAKQGEAKLLMANRYGGGLCSIGDSGSFLVGR